jgi:hypothetical protein
MVLDNYIQYIEKMMLDTKPITRPELTTNFNHSLAGNKVATGTE